MISDVQEGTCIPHIPIILVTLDQTSANGSGRGSGFLNILSLSTLHLQNSNPNILYAVISFSYIHIIIGKHILSPIVNANIPQNFHKEADHNISNLVKDRSHRPH